jgi:hypothetical protein
VDDHFLKITCVKNEDDAMKEALKSALQQRQNKVYKRDEVGTERMEFRREWSKLIRDESKVYIGCKSDDGRSDAEHCEAISRIAESLFNRFGEILKDGRLRYGTSQKALNLYLKYLWRMGMVASPLHCPVDSIVLNAGSIVGSWTKCDNESEYMRWIGELRENAKPLRLAEWEYQVWLRSAAK